MTLKNALLCFAAAAVSLLNVPVSRADDAVAATPSDVVSPAVLPPPANPAVLAPAVSPAVADTPVSVTPAALLNTPANAEPAHQPARSVQEADKPTVEMELAEVGEVYANGETLIEWPDPEAPSGHADLWERIRAGFGMPEIDSPLVQRHEAWYLNRPEYVDRMIARSRRYLFHVVEEVEKRHMPSEIALLPMIESAFNPAAYSHMHAAGMWQFIPSTGRKYGLQQTWWYDGRRDVLEATRAALDYLQYLHDMFDDWQLALAAYNWGEGAVQRAIERNRRAGLPTDYMSLTMPKETRNYLPKLQAVKNIITDPDLFNLSLDTIPNRPYFAVVTAPAHIDVAMAAKLANTPIEEFRNLNPAHYRPVITSETRRQLLVPVDKAEIFRANLKSNDQPLVSWQTYQLKRGERLDTVARKFDISQQRLREVNGLGESAGVRPGQMLLVPREDETDTNLDETYDSPDFQAPVNDYHKRAVYRVKRGDTLASIARRHHTTIARLKQWNGLRSLSVHTGQRLTIWQDAQIKAVRVKNATAAAESASKKRGVKATIVKQKSKQAVKHAGPAKGKKSAKSTGRHVTKAKAKTRTRPGTVVDTNDKRTVQTASR